MPAIKPPKQNMSSPARFIVEAAEEQNRILGHENLGFLSRSHGFMPIKPPLLAFPKTHEAWDEVASQLSYWYKHVQLRHELDKMPLLNANLDCLEDKYLWRASSFLGILLQAYYRAEVGEPSSIPDAIMKPLQQVSDRLGRTEVGITVNDLMTYNWRLKDLNNDVRIVENMHMLFDLYDTSEDAIFNLTITEIIYQSTPLVSSVIRIQEAMLNNDDKAIETELLLLADMANAMSQALQKINPLTYAPYRFNPIVWARTAGVFGIQHNSSAPGPGAVAAPFLHVLDALLGRKLYSSKLGQDEKHAIYLVDSPHLKKFLNAVEIMSVGDYIAARKNSSLQGTFMHFLEQYVGDSGFLGIHRRKVFGFLESALKVGKNTTTGRFQMQDIFFHRGWHQLNIILENAQKERLATLPAYYPKMTCKSKISSPEKSSAIIEFDLEGTGLRYTPGDYVQILVLNNEKRVQEVLKTLELDGNLPIELSKEWQQWLSLFEDYKNVSNVLPLTDFLRMARLSPITKDTLQKLYDITKWDKLKDLLRNRNYEQWDVREVLKLLCKRETFNIKRMFYLPAWDKENISKLIPPMQFKTYSVASHEKSDSRKTLSLMVSALHFPVYHGHNTWHDGVASVTLVEKIQPGDQFYIKFISNLQFKLPSSPSPIIMFAAGSGIAPFRGFLETATDQDLKNKFYLFLTVKNCDAIWYKRELEYWLNHIDLSFFMTSTGEDVIYVVQEENGRRKLVPKNVERKRIDSLMQQPSIKKLLSGLTTLHGTAADEGYFFLCGQAGFADTVQHTLITISDDEKEKLNLIAKLAGKNRYHASVFTSYVPDEKIVVEFDPSEVVLHNNRQTGYWIIINDSVYDITPYLDLHPGGPVVLINQTGLDATKEYEAIGHHLDGGINSLLSTYIIGKVHPLDFGRNNGGVTFLHNQYTYMSLEEFYHYWLSELYLSVEMVNTVSNMFNHYSVIVSSWQESAEELIFYRMQSTANDHANFICNYLSCILSRLTDLWSLSASMTYSNKDIFYLRDAFDNIKKSAAYNKNSAFDSLLLGKIKVTDCSPATLKEYYGVYPTLLDEILKNNLAYIVKIKTELREGILLFEKFSSKMLQSGSSHLLVHLDNTAGITENYLRNMEILYDKIMDMSSFSMQKDRKSEF